MIKEKIQDKKEKLSQLYYALYCAFIIYVPRAYLMICND